MRRNDKWVLFYSLLVAAMLAWFVVVAKQQPTPQETDTGSEYDLIGNNIERTNDLEKGVVCYRIAHRFDALSCVKL